MHERRECYRFRAAPGGDPIWVTGKDDSSAAHLVDTSSGGLSVQLTGSWAPSVGQKVEVELAHDERVVAEVVRAWREESGTVLGLRRVAEAWDDRETGQSVRVASVRSGGLPTWLTAVVVIVGMVLGMAAWNWRSLLYSSGHANQAPGKSNHVEKPAQTLPKTGARISTLYAASSRESGLLVHSA